MTKSLTMGVDERQRRRRNLLLFAVHVGLALAVLAWFVYSVTHK